MATPRVLTLRRPRRRITPVVRAALFLAALVVPTARAGAQSVSVKEVRPSQVRLAAGGSSGSVVLSGAGLAAVTAGYLTQRGRTVQEVDVRVRLTGKDEVTVAMTATAKAPSLEATLTLRLRDGSTAAVPGLTVAVVAAAPAVARLDVDRAVLTEGDRSALGVTLAAAASADVVVRLTSSARALEMPSQVTVRAGASRVKVPISAGATSGSVSVEITAATVSGASTTTVEIRPRPSFQPRHTATSMLAFTGLRFEALQRSTAPLVFTGLRFEPVRRSTAALAFTGLRFEPLRRTTPPLVMTGISSNPVR